MQTRCPHCQTLFEIQQEQLLAASGQARCSHCDNIFNARKNLLQDESEDLPKTPVESTAEEIGFSLNELFEERESRAGASTETGPKLPGATVAGDDPQRAQRAGGHRPAPALDAQHKDSAIEDPHLSAPDELADDRYQAGDTQDSTDELPAYLRATPRRKGVSNRNPLLWSVMLICMIAIALGQLTWFSRDRLQDYPEIRQLLEVACGKLNCTLPPWHEPEKFRISRRTVASHPETDQALQIQLTFSNQAKFAQAYPVLQLSLYDLNESLSARRRFTPQEYLEMRSDRQQRLLPPGASVEVDMALRDPGREITAFIIEFL